MKVQLDKFEMYYLLESCFRGSHLRSSTILRFVDEWYRLIPEKRGIEYYQWILRDIYNGEFKPSPNLCGADKTFMARYNPDNRYMITLINGEQVDAFLMDGRYYVLSNRYIAEETIKKVDKI